MKKSSIMSTIRLASWISDARDRDWIDSFKLVHANLDHVADVSKNIARHDLADIEYFTGGKDPVRVLEEGFHNSVFAFAIIWNGKTAGVGGILASGRVWLMFVEGVINSPYARRALLYWSRPVLDILRQAMPHVPLYNYTLASNKKIIRWLEWLGATILPLQPLRNAVYFSFPEWGDGHKFTPKEV